MITGEKIILGHGWKRNKALEKAPSVWRPEGYNQSGSMAQTYWNYANAESAP